MVGVALGLVGAFGAVAMSGASSLGPAQETARYSADCLGGSKAAWGLVMPGGALSLTGSLIGTGEHGRDQAPAWMPVPRVCATEPTDPAACRGGDESIPTPAVDPAVRSAAWCVVRLYPHLADGQPSDEARSGGLVVCSDGFTSPSQIPALGKVVVAARADAGQPRPLPLHREAVAPVETGPGSTEVDGGPLQAVAPCIELASAPPRS